MGWERKRGKIEEFNRLLRGATDTSFVGRRSATLAVLPPACATASRSTPTRACRATRRSKLIGIIAHPLNRPRFDPRLGRVTEGYGILQPRVSVTMASAAGSLFARLYAGHTGVDPYTTAVSDTYQDLFDEGIFTGKGLYDVDAFMAALEGRGPGERAALARPVRGALRAHGARHRRRGGRRLSRRASSRTRAGSTAGCAATGRSCCGCSRSCPLARACSRNRLPLISRWKILDNLRRSLVAPATAGAAGRWLDDAARASRRCGRPRCWPGSPSASPAGAARLLGGPPAQQPLARLPARPAGGRQRRRWRRSGCS